jgi:DNA-binding GntR family transcriptional regulator
MMASDYLDKIDVRLEMMGDQISEMLKKAIINNELKGGEKIIESRLQKKMGVSRSPIREALRNLEKIGLVEIKPRIGTTVTRITRKDIEENYRVRAPLEGLAAGEAHSLLKPGDMQKLEESLSGMKRAAEAKDIKRYWICHSEFHDTFINASGNDLLIDLLIILRTHSVRHRLAFPNFKEDLNASATIHETIVRMFQDKAADKDKIRIFVTQHILDALPGFISNISEFG